MVAVVEVVRRRRRLPTVLLSVVSVPIMTLLVGTVMAKIGMP